MTLTITQFLAIVLIFTTIGIYIGTSIQKYMFRCSKDEPILYPQKHDEVVHPYTIDGSIVTSNGKKYVCIKGTWYVLNSVEIKALNN